MDTEILIEKLQVAMPGTEARAVFQREDGTTINGVVEKVTVRRPPAGRAYIEILVSEE
jgi:hypothetical protein